MVNDVYGGGYAERVDDERDTGPPGLGERTAFQLFKLGWWVQRRTEEAAAEQGINGREFLVIEMAGASGGISQQEMATYMSLDPTPMVAIVDSLEERGLCRRERDASDRRRYLVRLTPKGRAARKRAQSAFEAIEDEVLAPLSAAERRTLGDVAERVMEPYWAAKVNPRGRRRG
jgi:DNA-binding MarR family transcriptional regulator